MDEICRGRVVVLVVDFTDGGLLLNEKGSDNDFRPCPLVFDMHCIIT